MDSKTKNDLNDLIQKNTSQLNHIIINWEWYNQRVAPLSSVYATMELYRRGESISQMQVDALNSFALTSGHKDWDSYLNNFYKENNIDSFQDYKKLLNNDDESVKKNSSTNTDKIVLASKALKKIIYTITILIPTCLVSYFMFDQKDFPIVVGIILLISHIFILFQLLNAGNALKQSGE